MIMKIRKVWPVLLAVVMVLGFAVLGCSSDDPPPILPPPPAPTITVNFAASGAGTTAVTGGNNGTVTYATGAFTFTYGTVTNSNYGNAICRFKVDLGSSTLGGYGKITFTWSATGDIASSKNLFLLASQTESAITPWKSDADIDARKVSGAKAVNGAGPTAIEIPITGGSALTGDVWFSIFAAADTPSSFTISNLKFVPK